MTYPRGLGGLGDASSDFAAAKTRWESQVGVPYTGNATTAEQLLGELPVLAQIANGSLQAAVDGMHHPDPQVAGIARTYAQRAAQENPQAAAQVLTPEEFHALVGQELNAQPWWRQQRETRVSQALFPILGAGSGVFSGHAGNLSLGFDYPADIYAYDFDFGALTQAAEAFKSAHAGAVTTPGADAIATSQAAPAGAAPAGPPAGWRWNGSNGWWGPDGQFYPGAQTDTPWTGGSGGVSVTTFRQPPPPPSAGSSSPGGGGGGGAASTPPPGASTSTAAPPTAATAVPEGPSSTPVEMPMEAGPVGIPDAQYAGSEDVPVEGAGMTGAAPAEAGMGGLGGLLILGAGVGLLLAGRKKRKR